MTARAETRSGRSQRTGTRKPRPEDPLVREARLRAERLQAVKGTGLADLHAPVLSTGGDAPQPTIGTRSAELDRTADLGYFQGRIEHTTGAAPSSMHAASDVDVPFVPMIRASDLVAEPLEFIWNGRIARGKLTMLAGDPGLGKSLLAAYMAAVVSQGGNWSSGGGQAPRGSVIMVTPEDGLQDTVRPRLEAAGADLDTVHLLPDLDLVQDLEGLEQSVNGIPNVKLVIIDPITSCLGTVNLNGTSQVRRVLEPLSRFAARAGIAVVCITHLNKSRSGRAMARMTGSHAFVAVARSAFILCKDKHDPARRLLLPVKNNLGADEQSLGFRVEETPVGKGAAPRLVFDSDPVTVTADEALNGSRDDQNSLSAIATAKEFLLDYLAAGPAPARDVQAAANAELITPMSLRRAKESLGVVSKKSNMSGQWQWQLPLNAKMINSAEDAHSNHMSTFAQDDHLRETNGTTGIADVATGEGG